MKTDLDTAAPDEQRPKTPNVKVLAVDDDADILDLFSGILVNEPIELIQAQDANEGLRLFAEFEPADRYSRPDVARHARHGIA